MKTIRIGIIGTGRIAGRFAGEVRTVPEAQVTSVYNPHRGSARHFVDKFHMGEPTDSMERLLELTDAVYIASPHASHVPYTRHLLGEGKHVLCEKPLAFSAKEASELFTLAGEKGLVLMEALKTAYCPGFLALLDKVRSGVIGEVCDIEAAFTKLSPSNVREIWDEQYGGSFPELGSYTLFPIVKLLGTGHTDIQFQTVRMGNGKEGYTKAILSYPEAMAEARTGLSVKSEGQLLVSGTKGYILAEAPWWLTKKFEVRYEDPAIREVYEYSYEGAGLRYEIQAFVERIHAEGDTHKAVDGKGAEAEKLSGGEKRSDLPGVTPEESIWIARQMEAFLAYGERQGCRRAEYSMARTARKAEAEERPANRAPVRIWGHRGCSMRYPENTLESFAAAAALPGIAGVELDVQLTKDGVLIVMHDEAVDRTTDGTGQVLDFTLEELKQLTISGVNGVHTKVPTLEEVFRLLESPCHEKGLMVNIELKNSLVRYEGMEEKVLAMAARFGLDEHIIYSSFLPESMGLIKRLNPAARTGILGVDALGCLAEMAKMGADAIHPSVAGLPLEEREIRRIHGIPVRVWGGDEPLFGQKRPLRETNMPRYQAFGATDIITNVPENYL